MTQSSTTPDNVPFVRTPDANFVGLDDFRYPPNYLTFEGLRLHYVDVGPADGPVALMLHGMPTWNFLYRHIIARSRTRRVCARCATTSPLSTGRPASVSTPG